MRFEKEVDHNGHNEHDERQKSKQWEEALCGFSLMLFVVTVVSLWFESFFCITFFRPAQNAGHNPTGLARLPQLKSVLKELNKWKLLA